MNSIHIRKSFIATFIILFPLLPIIPGLFDFSKGFYTDWWTNVWNIEYQSRHFGAHLSTPSVMHTWDPEKGIGRPDAIFYGFIFYPIMGIISQLISTNLALRLGIIILWLMQFMALKKIFIRLTDHNYLTYSISALFLWGIYPLTNLYNRSALTESFGTGFLLCALCYLFIFLWSDSNSERWKNSALLGIFLVLSIGTHPITALYGSTLLVIVILFSLISRVSDLSKKLSILIAIFFLSLIAVSPWVYMTIRYVGDLAISSSPGVSVYPESIDWPLSRFLPFPLDKRSLIHGWQVPGGTPWLEAQINLPLLLLFIGMVVSLKIQFHKLTFRDKVYLVYPLLLFLLTTLMSLSSTIWEFLPSIYKNIQMSYRMVTYQNLSIVLALISVCYIVKPKSRSKNSLLFKRIVIVTNICLSISAIGVVQKLMHGLAIMGDMNPPPISSEKPFLSNPRTSGHSNYVLSSIQEVEGEPYQNVQFLPDPFGTSQASEYRTIITLKESSWIRTNVQAFPWNRFSLNGVPIETKAYQRIGPKLALFLPIGENHLTYFVEQDSTYTLLKCISWILVTAWIFVCIIIVVRGYFFVPELKTSRIIM